MGKYYKLTANIYLNDVTDPEWMDNSPNSWFTTDSAERFGGNIDGDGYTIFGLYFNGTAAGALTAGMRAAVRHPRETVAPRRRPRGAAMNYGFSLRPRKRLRKRKKNSMPCFMIRMEKTR